VKNIPKVIYLNIGDIGQDVFDEESFNDLAREEITWSEDRIDEFDIEYTESSQLELVQKIAEVVKPFAMAFDDLKATRLHPEDDEFQKFEDGNLIIPTKGLNSGHFRKIWELYNQLSNFPA